MEMRVQNDTQRAAKHGRPEANQASWTKDESVKKKKREHVEAQEINVEEPPTNAKRKSKDLEGSAAEGDSFVDPEAFKVVVAGIPFSVEESVIRRDFSECGEILNLRLLKM